MIRWIELCYRTVVTAFCFAGFGVGSMLVSFTLFPALRVACRNRARRALLSKRINSGLFRAFISVVSRARLISYEISGAEHLRSGGQLILANHPTLLDVVFLISIIERADCVVKGSLAKNPFTRGPVLSAGYVFNDSGDGLVDACVRSVQAGNNLIVFPEGTRSREGVPMKLHRGAARIALTGNLDVLPVKIKCSPLMLGKTDRWFRVPRIRPHFTIEVGTPIPIAQFNTVDDSAAISARNLTKHLIDYFNSETPNAAT